MQCARLFLLGRGRFLQRGKVVSDWTGLDFQDKVKRDHCVKLPVLRTFVEGVAREPREGTITSDALVRCEETDEGEHYLSVELRVNQKA